MGPVITIVYSTTSAGLDQTNMPISNCSKRKEVVLPQGTKVTGTGPLSCCVFCVLWCVVCDPKINLTYSCSESAWQHASQRQTEARPTSSGTMGEWTGEC